MGKTTMVEQVVGRSGLLCRFVSADEPTLRGPEWIAQQWDVARLVADGAGRAGAILVVDEVQKAPNWRRRSSACGTKTLERAGD